MIDATPRGRPAPTQAPNSPTLSGQGLQCGDDGSRRHGPALHPPIGSIDPWGVVTYGWYPQREESEMHEEGHPGMCCGQCAADTEVAKRGEATAAEQELQNLTLEYIKRIKSTHQPTPVAIWDTLVRAADAVIAERASKTKLPYISNTDGDSQVFPVYCTRTGCKLGLGGILNLLNAESRDD